MDSDKSETWTGSCARALLFGPKDIHDRLVHAATEGASPSVIGYHRIDGPGSSLSLPLFQRSFARLCEVPQNPECDPTWSWSRGLPRTIGWTISTGTRVTAKPAEWGKLVLESEDYEALRRVEGAVGSIPPIKRNWILKIMEFFGLNGVAFSLRNLDPRTRSSGLGGSATATTAAALLANELLGKPLCESQVVALASVWENDLGVSLTGTQEQWNVVIGGVTDYVWFPWGRPHSETGYGDAVFRSLLPSELYHELASRSILVHTGVTRASRDVNKVWSARLRTMNGYRLQRKKMAVAYTYATAIQQRDWELVAATIEEYRALRTKLCPDYMHGAHELMAIARKRGAVVFPLGAGGGGCVHIWSPTPSVIAELSEEISKVQDQCQIIEFTIRTSGHDMINIPKYAS